MTRTLIPLSEVRAENVPTNEAAEYLGRKPDTLRKWTYSKAAPITPVKVAGRLMWRVSDIRRLLASGG